MPPARLLAACLLLLTPAAWSAEPVEFNRDIRPILSDNCFQCHGPDEGHREAGLRLDSEEGSRADLGGYAAVAAGDPDASALVERIEIDDADLRMPPADSGKQLTAEQRALLRRWVEQGAKYQRHWSLSALRRPAVPPVEDSQWPQQAIDHFILWQLESAGVNPSPPADRVTLLRRLHFDLTGLPPTPADVDAFLADTRPGAYQRRVDQLLASPRFGERMAIYWLDLVRYADSVGYHGDQEHNAAPFREYVIRAFNSGMPFDRFTVEQLAGDLLPSPSDDQRVASGYNRLLQTTHEGGAQNGEYLAKYAADRVRNVSAVWMSATMGCAECHEHKYDPYPQADFYRLASFFADLKEQGNYKASNSSPTQRPPEIDVLSPPDRDLLRWIDDQLQDARHRKAALAEQGTEQSAQQAAELDARIQQLEARREDVASRIQKQMVSQAVEPRVMRVLPRGNWMDDSGPVVEPGVPECLPPLDVQGRRATRLDLARWLTSAEHPQTSRALANRLWYLLFGEGLSRVLDDIGSQGEAPTHPQLLDHLAVELIESGWDVKHLVRQIVTSAAYQQSSLADPQQLEADPENRLLARQGRFRLSAEMIRDQALAVSGLLVERLGGPSARPYQPAGYYSHLNFPTRTYQPDDGAGLYRRGVYMHWQRQFLHPMLRAFDAPSREECTAGRPRSNTPQSALVLLNDPTFVEAARQLAGRVLRGDSDDSARLRRIWRLAVSREPAAEETAVLARLLSDRRRRYQADTSAAEQLLSTGLSPAPEEAPAAELAAWTCLARVVLSLNETTTRN